MKQKFEVTSSRHEELIDITEAVEKAVQREKIQEGICVVYTPHTTAGITINENEDPDVLRDILYGLERMIPDEGFHHSEGNSTAHIKSSLMGCSKQVLVEKGKLQLGTWQGIYFCEFDGPRTRQVWVQVMKRGEEA